MLKAHEVRHRQFDLNIDSIVFLGEPVGSTQCTLCKYVVAYVDAVIQTNKSEAAIDAALEKVCTILPQSLRTACVQFVDTYGPVLVDYIAKYASPTEVCDAMKLCQNGTQTIPKPVSRKFHLQSNYFRHSIV